MDKLIEKEWNIATLSKALDKISDEYTPFWTIKTDKRSRDLYLEVYQYDSQDNELSSNDIDEFLDDVINVN